jgi:hypothetical protein
MKQSKAKPSQANEKEEELGYFTLSILGFGPHLMSPGSPTETYPLTYVSGVKWEDALVNLNLLNWGPINLGMRGHFWLSGVVKWAHKPKKIL